MKDSVVRWFTIEPVTTDTVEESRMAHNINAVKAQMVGNARNQFADWLKNDAPFKAIVANPKLVREVTVTNVSLLEDSTAVIEFMTSTTQSPTDKPDVQRYALTWRYQIVPPTAQTRLRPTRSAFSIRCSRCRRSINDPTDPTVFCHARRPQHDSVRRRQRACPRTRQHGPGGCAVRRHESDQPL
jgi:VirB8 protein